MINQPKKQAELATAKADSKEKALVVALEKELANAKFRGANETRIKAIETELAKYKPVKKEVKKDK